MPDRPPSLNDVTPLDFPGAACTGEATALFFGPGRREAKEAKAAREELAKSHCAVCPHRAACLEHARAFPEPDGIWGGTTAGERVASPQPRRTKTPR